MMIVRAYAQRVAKIYQSVKMSIYIVPL